MKNWIIGAMGVLGWLLTGIGFTIKLPHPYNTIIFSLGLLLMTFCILSLIIVFIIKLVSKNN